MFFNEIFCKILKKLYTFHTCFALPNYVEIAFHIFILYTSENLCTNFDLKRYFHFIRKARFSFHSYNTILAWSTDVDIIKFGFSNVLNIKVVYTLKP